MKNEYTSPVMETVIFETEDVISTSCHKDHETEMIPVS